jgi:alpha-glucosidase
MLTHYRKLIAIRRKEPALAIGSYRPVVSEGDLIAYVREHEQRRFLVVLNLGPRPSQLALDALGSGTIEIATEHRREGQRVEGRIVLRGDDGLLVRLD